MAARSDTEIVLVHGLWFGSWALARLAHRLERGGLPVRCFGYRTTRDDLAAHAARLHEFASTSRVDTQHFVGHSLGGLVILRMLMDFEDVAPGRLVFLGSPLKGSVVARRAENIPGSSVLMWQVRGALESGYPAIPGGREAGMIAGSKSIGLGWLVGGTDGPGDGTVAVSETVADGLKDHCVLPVTHTGMLYSKTVAKKTARFLESGAFGCNTA